MNDTTLSLSLPTDRTRRGPIFRKDGETVVIEYDYEQDDGSIQASVLVFIEVLNFEYRQGILSEATDFLSPTEMLCLRQSERLATVMNLWQERVGWHDFQAKQGGAGRFRHYKMCFEDAGFVDIIASGMRPASPSAA